MLTQKLAVRGCRASPSDVTEREALWILSAYTDSGLRSAFRTQEHRHHRHCADRCVMNLLLTY